jgi:hypothetical protein
MSNTDLTENRGQKTKTMRNTDPIENRGQKTKTMSNTDLIENRGRKLRRYCRFQIPVCHFPALSSFMTYYRICNYINTTGAPQGI